MHKRSTLSKIVISALIYIVNFVVSIVILSTLALSGGVSASPVYLGFIFFTLLPGFITYLVIKDKKYVLAVMLLYLLPYLLFWTVGNVLKQVSTP